MRKLANSQTKQRKRNANDTERGEIMEGDKYCTVCGDWIGNYFTGFTPDGERSFQSIIRMKYCKLCRPKMISQQTKARLQKLRESNKQKRKAEKTKLQLLTEENEILRNKIIQLREEGQNV